MEQTETEWLQTWAYFGIDGSKSGWAEELYGDEKGGDYCYGWYMYLKPDSWLRPPRTFKSEWQKMGYEDAAHHFESD